MATMTLAIQNIVQKKSYKLSKYAIVATFVVVIMIALTSGWLSGADDVALGRKLQIVLAGSFVSPLRTAAIALGFISLLLAVTTLAVSKPEKSWISISALSLSVIMTVMLLVFAIIILKNTSWVPIPPKP